MSVVERYPQLVLLEGQRVRQRHALEREPLTMGRSPDNAIVVDHPSVSRFQVRVNPAAGRWMVNDLQSSGGTFLNGARVEYAFLSHGDVIRAGGDVKLVYLERPDDLAVDRARGGKFPATPPPGSCPACWTTISRLRPEDDLPDACPRCRSTITPVEGPVAPNFVRTRFRLGLTTTIAEVPCVVREPMPAPPQPRTSGVHAPTEPVELVPKFWGTAALRHAAPLSALALTDAGLVRAGDAAGEVRTWDLDAAEEVERFTAPGPVVALSPAGGLVLVDRRDTYSVHSATDGAALWSLDLGQARGNGTFDAEGRVSMYTQGLLSQFSRDGRTAVFEDADTRAPVTLACGGRGNHLLTVHPDAARLRDGNRLVAVLQPPGSVFHAGAVTCDGTACALGLRTEAGVRAGALAQVSPGPRLAVLLWHPVEARVSVIAEQLPAPPVVVALSDDASLVAWADATGRVSIVDATTLKGPRDRPLHARPVRSLVIDSRNRRVISAGLDGRLRTLRADDDAPMPAPDPPGHAGGLPRLHPSADGQRMASTALDGTLRIWDVSTGAEVSRWPLQVSPFLKLALAPTARRVATFDTQGVTARVAATGQFLWSRPVSGPSAPSALAWTEDGRALVIAHGGALTWLDGMRSTQVSRVAVRLDASHEPLLVTRQGDLVARDGPEAIALVSGTGGHVIRRHRVSMDARVMAVAPDATAVALWRPGQAIEVVALREGDRFQLETPEEISTMALAPGGRTLAIAYTFLGLQVYWTDKRSLAARWVPGRRLSPADQRLDALSFTSDRRELVGATREGPLAAFRLP